MSHIQIPASYNTMLDRRNILGRRLPRTTAAMAARPSGVAAPNDPPPAASDLVIFMSPVASEIKPGEKVRITLTVSGGSGLSSGTLELRLPPGLRLQRPAGHRPRN